MTGIDFQNKLDALVEDLQKKGKVRSIEIPGRTTNNTTGIFNLSSDANGVVNASELNQVQNFIDPLKLIADNYEVEYEPVKSASEALRLAQMPHEALITAASATASSVSLNLSASFRCPRRARRVPFAD